MRFYPNRDHTFPTPVILNDGGDYKNASFNITIKPAITGKTDTQVQLNTEYNLEQKDIEKLLEKKIATMHLSIYSQKTGYSDLIKLNHKEINKQIDLPDSSIIESFHARAVIQCETNIKDFTSKDFIDDFKNLKFNIRKGCVLGLSNEETFNVNFPIKPLGADIFETNQVKGMNKGEFDLDISDISYPKIIINVGESINKEIQKNQNTEIGEILNISMVYLPIISELIHQIRLDPPQYKSAKWYRSLSDALQKIGVEIDDHNVTPLKIAQRILNTPFIETIKRLAEEYDK